MRLWRDVDHSRDPEGEQVAGRCIRYSKWLRKSSAFLSEIKGAVQQASKVFFSSPRRSL